jgi:hypothetical protein
MAGKGRRWRDKGTKKGCFTYKNRIMYMYSFSGSLAKGRKERMGGLPGFKI